MIPAAAAVPPHSLNTLDRIAFYKSVREKRKQLQLNHHTNGKETVSSSTENAFLTQMLQSSSNSTTSTSSLNIPSLLHKGDYSPSTTHRSVSSTLTNILPALLNGTLPSPRAITPTNLSTTNHINLTSPTSTDTLVNIKCSTSLPVSPATKINDNNPIDCSNNTIVASTSSSSSSPPRCRSYPMTDLDKRTSSSSTSSVSPTQNTHQAQSIATSTAYLLATASSCPSLITSTINSNHSTSPSPDDNAPKIVRSASVKSCASDSGVSSSSPLSDNNIVHVFRTNHIEANNQPQLSTGSRKRKSLAHFYDELNKDKKFSTEATVSSTFPSISNPIANNNNNNIITNNTNNNNNNGNTNNSNIPYSQQEALAIGYAQYALMHTLTQQFRVNYPAAFLHAAAASAYLPLTSPMMAAAVAAAAASANSNGNQSISAEKFCERRKQPESDSNNNHIRANTSFNEQPYQRETYQTLLESSRLLGQQKLHKPVPIDLRKPNGTNDRNSHTRCPSSSSSTSPSNSPPCSTPPKSTHSTESNNNNDFVCIPKKLMPVIGARINDWLERSVQFTLSLVVLQETLVNDEEKLALLSRIWHRLLLISMIENSFEIYVTKDLQITQDVSSSPSSITTNYPTENDVKQIESLISRGKTLDIDEVGFNLIREVIVYKEGKTRFENSCADSFERAECQAQTRLTAWCSSRVKYSKIVFFLCNIYQVKEDIFERLFCTGSMHQSTPIRTHLERFLASASTDDA